MSKTGLFIALRYLFSRKSTNVIHLISGISVLGIWIATAALVILLSAFNGLEAWVLNLYDSFDPDLRIESVQKKYLSKEDFEISKLDDIEEIEHYSVCLEETGLIRYKDAQYACIIKGVDKNYLKVSGIDSTITEGLAPSFLPYKPDAALVGAGISYILSLALGDVTNPLEIYLAKADAIAGADPTQAFRNAIIYPSGIYTIQPEFDSRYLIVPLEFCRALSQRENMWTHVELKLKPGVDSKAVKSKIANLLGDSFVIKDRFDQHELMYKIVNSEKWAVYLILSFILVIAAFSVIGALTMLIVEKQKDIKTLYSLGATEQLIREIFFAEGLFIGLIGMFLGVLTGLSIVYAQDSLGFVLMNEYEPYPVKVKLSDIILVCSTLLIIISITAYIPSSRIKTRIISTTG